MDFQLTDEIKAISELARNFTEKEIIPFADAWDLNHEYPKEVVRKMGSLGFFGAMIPEEYGGTNMGYLAQTVICEEISRGSSSLRVTFNMQAAGTALPLLRYGTKEQKEKYIPGLISGDLTGAFAITESEAGSDVMSMRTVAKPMGDYFLINGSKTWISNATVADTCILYAYTDPAARSKGMSILVIDMNTPGISTKVIEKIGTNASPTGEIILEDVKVPRTALLGNMGEGVKMLFSSLNQTRLFAAAGGVGLAQACLDAATKYCRERVQFGQEIGQFQMNQDLIAVMATEVEAARLLVYKAAVQKDQGMFNNGREVAMAKFFAAETAIRAAEFATRILSAYGYSLEYPVGRYYKDAKAVQLVEGTVNVQKMIIALDQLGYRKASQ